MTDQRGRNNRPLHFADLRPATGDRSFEPDYKPCKVCAGAGKVWVDKPYEFAGRQVTGLTELVPCPKCGQRYCQTCGDSGLIKYDVPTGHDWFGQLFPCPDCERGQDYARKAQASGIQRADVPRHYVDFTFDTWSRLGARHQRGKELAYAAAYLWAENASHGCRVSLGHIYELAGLPMDRADSVKNSIVLTGDYGTGKTGLAIAAISRLNELGYAPVYLRFADLLRNLRDAMDKRDRKNDPETESPEGVLDRIRKAPVLVIDDFATHNTTEWQLDQAETIIRYRHGEELPTLVTTNDDREAFRARWAGRTSTVLYEMAHEIKVGGVPLRDEGQTISETGV